MDGLPVPHRVGRVRLRPDSERSRLVLAGGAIFCRVIIGYCEDLIFVFVTYVACAIVHKHAAVDGYDVRYCKWNSDCPLYTVRVPCQTSRVSYPRKANEDRFGFGLATR